MLCGSGWFCSFVKWLEKGLISCGLFFYYTSLHLFPYGVFLSFLNLFLLLSFGASFPLLSHFLLFPWLHLFAAPLIYSPFGPLYLSLLPFPDLTPSCLTRNIQKFHFTSLRSQRCFFFQLTLFILGQRCTQAILSYLLWVLVVLQHCFCAHESFHKDGEVAGMKFLTSVLFSFLSSSSLLGSSICFQHICHTIISDSLLNASLFSLVITSKSY